MLEHPPAIIQVRPALDLRLHINGEQVDNPLPRDFLAMPRVLRATVSLKELRRYLPAEYRLVPDGLLAGLVYANLPGFPGAIMAGNARIKKAWLYVSNGQFQVPGDWNRRDNISHAVGGGANGQTGVVQGSGNLAVAQGGPGGGGAAWAMVQNRNLPAWDMLDVVIAPGGTSSSPTWFMETNVLLAASGAMGSGGTGGQGGQASSSVGDQANSGRGGDGTSQSVGSSASSSGGRGGGAGGPHGDGTYDGDAGQGGAAGALGNIDGGNGVDGPAGGFNPGEDINAGSGGSGFLGFSDPLPGGNGGYYGGGAGGGGATVFGGVRIGGQGRQGCVLLINNTEA